MKRLSLALAVLCGFLGDSARADDKRRGHEWYQAQSGPVLPGGSYWMDDDPLYGPGTQGRFGRGRRFDHDPYAMPPAPGWGGPYPVLPPPEPQWPQPGVGLPHEGHGAFGYYQPGDFVQGPVPLYPHVRVKDAKKAPRHAVTVVLAVAVSDRRGLQHSVFVPVRVPTRPLRDMKVDKGGSKIKLDYEDYEVEIESKNGVVTVEYDD